MNNKYLLNNMNTCDKSKENSEKKVVSTEPKKKKRKRSDSTESNKNKK